MMKPGAFRDSDTEEATDEPVLVQNWFEELTRLVCPPPIATRPSARHTPAHGEIGLPYGCRFNRSMQRLPLV